jgi:misacylated tRNA(Ala) deacylase
MGEDRHAVSVYLCHLEPELFDFDAEVTAARPGQVLLSRSALHPGGGGQVSDTAVLEHRHGTVRVTGVQAEGGEYWHVLDDPGLELAGSVAVRIDRERRSRVAQLHTDTHILNALVYDQFAGALVTGAQINGDGTARMDFDLPAADNETLRGLEPALNAIIDDAAEVCAIYIPAAEAESTPGLIRSLSVAPPPTPDGQFRVIEIVGVDRQACGGTHLANTGQSLPVRITKVENKGRRNRRVRLALHDPARESS